MYQEPVSEVERSDIAYLEDRVRVNTARPQLYGTQFDFDRLTNQFTPKTIEQVAGVDYRRKDMGLGTLKEGIKEMYRKYNISQLQPS